MDDSDVDELNDEDDDNDLVALYLTSAFSVQFNGCCLLFLFFRVKAYGISTFLLFLIAFN